MFQTPETAYAVVDDTHIAYQAMGRGQNLVLVVDWFSHLDAMWEWPPYATALRRLGSFSRFVAFDKRGVGLSDPAPPDAAIDLEGWMHDLLAVMDASGFERANFFAVGSGGPMTLTFAATHPERVNKLVLVNSYARLLADVDYRPGWPAEARDAILSGGYASEMTASALNGEALDMSFNNWWRRYQRQAVSPSVASAVREMMFRVDVRSVLSSVLAETLVLHRTGDRWIRAQHGEYLAKHLPNATYLGLPGSEDLFFQGDVGALLDETEAFLGIDDAPVDRPSDRILGTVLFTDIVGSTAKAASLGDTAWRRLLDSHDSVTQRHVDKCGGRLVKATGDGIVALFDGPRSAMEAAARMRDDLATIDLRVRSGLHTGEVEVRGDDIGGIAVNLGARVMGLAEADEILVSSTVKQLLTGSEISFTARGSHQLKGIPDEWDIFELQL